MKGIIKRDEKEWVVSYLSEYKQSHSSVNEWRYIPLHPDDTKTCKQYGDYSIDWQGKKVEFEIVTEWENGEVGVNGLTYAKLINNIPDVIEDDYIEELAKGEIGWYDKHDDDQVKSFISGYNKAKETLYTEEEVKQAINRAVMLTLSDKSCYSDEIIKSLKQTKK